MYGMVVIASVVIVVALMRRAPLPTPRWWKLGLVAALLQLPAYLFDRDNRLLSVSYLLLCLVAWRNRYHAGGSLICAGLLLNALPILIDGRMPIGATLLAWGGQHAVVGAALLDSKDMVVSWSPLLIFGDILPVSLGSWHAAWSIGDVVLCCGMLWYAFANRPLRLLMPWRPSRLGG